jgi:hypothetical protein
MPAAFPLACLLLRAGANDVAGPGKDLYPTMRHLAIWRFAVILLLAAIPLAAPALAPATIADNGTAGSGNDHDRGHGNDPDGHDEDNPGNSSGPGKDTNDKQEKAVETITAGYAVTVDCHPTDDGVATACAFAATAPEGGKKVTFLQVPAETLCTEVVASEADLVDSDSKTHVTGYVSHGSDATLSLVLDGPVTVAGTATYWIKAGGNVFPAEGPGFRCDLAAATAAGTAVTFEVEATATPRPSTGTVAVVVLTCAGIPANTAGFDWFGACPPGSDPPRTFTLTPSDASGETVTTTTDKTGEATFADVAPGDYRLDLVDGSWCRAVSDRVTADSEVVVEAGARSTVWIFVCEPRSGV